MEKNCLILKKFVRKFLGRTCLSNPLVYWDLGAILKTSGTLYAILRLLGIAYLIYLGIKSFLDANKGKR